MDLMENDNTTFELDTFGEDGSSLMFAAESSWRNKKPKPHIFCTAFVKWVVTYTACPLRKLTWIVNLKDSRCKDSKCFRNFQTFC